MKFNFKKLVFYILITFLIGNLFVSFTFGTDFFKELNKPVEVAPIIFPIVWSILYLLMGISVYLISNKKGNSKEKIGCIWIYFVQLSINSFWTLVFFGFRLYFVAFLVLVALIIAVIFMLYRFYRVDKVACYLNILYLLWLLFAGYLNFFIFLLN